MFYGWYFNRTLSIYVTNVPYETIYSTWRPILPIVCSANSLVQKIEELNFLVKKLMSTNHHDLILMKIPIFKWKIIVARFKNSLFLHYLLQI